MRIFLSSIISSSSLQSVAKNISASSLSHASLAECERDCYGPREANPVVREVGKTLSYGVGVEVRIVGETRLA
jgi:hypothetical protein